MILSVLAGHFTTALIAKQRAPRGHMGYYLIASQLPDLLWLVFHYLGLERTSPDNMLAVSLDSLDVEMTYSHDLLPMLGWVVATAIVGRALFGWRPGLAGGAIVAVHVLIDYVGGFPHHVFGPDTHAVGTGLYGSAPYLAVGIEVVFIAVTMWWVSREDKRAGIQRSSATLRAWAGVFLGGVGFMFMVADQSLAETFGIELPAALSGTAVPLLAFTYIAMIVALLWADRQPAGSKVSD